MFTASAQVDLNRAYSEGMRAYDAKNWASAIEHLSSIVKAKPDGPGEAVLYRLGFAQYFNLSYQEAADTFQLYLKNHP